MKFKSFRKRGLMEVVLQPAFVTVVVLGLVLLSVLSGLMRLGNTEYYAKQYESRNIALFLESAYTAPGNVYFFYESKNNFSFDISNDGKVSVFKGAPNDPQKDTYFFVPGKEALNSITLSGSSKILVTKTRNELSISKLDDVFPDFFEEDCVPEKRPLGNVLLDPSSSLAKDRTFAVASVVPYKSIRRTAADMPDLEERKKALTTADTIISIGVEDRDDKKNHILVYYNADSINAKVSKYLGCEIMNSISSFFKEDIYSASLVPFSPEQILLDDDMQVLDTDKPGVFIIIGNIQAEPLDPSNLGVKIKEGIDKYGK